MCCRRVRADSLAVPLAPRAPSFFSISFPAFPSLRRIRNRASPIDAALQLIALMSALLFACGSLVNAQTSGASNSAARPRVVELRIGDEIEPIMAEYIDGAMTGAAQQHASLILITMDTPGGLGTSMEDIIQHI